MTDLEIRPSLQSNYRISQDVYPPLFGLFSHPYFTHWMQGNGTWSLKLTGGPGSGKTTLAALTVQYLRAQPTASLVAAIFVTDGLNPNPHLSMETLLDDIYFQLQTRLTLGNGVTEELILDAQAGGGRIELLQDLLHKRIQDCDRPFLILDGLDHCSAECNLIIEDELVRLQSQGLRILTTSRSNFKSGYIICDECKNDAPDLHWHCNACETVDLCYQCKEDGKPCPSCGQTNTLVEPYQHVEYLMSLVENEDVKKFVEWDLEREHGDLGLKSGSCDHTLPPLSTLGEALANHSDGLAITKSIVDRIVDRAKRNVSLARLYLDEVHRESSDPAKIMDTNKGRPRLPTTVLAMFDQLIGTLCNLPQYKRNVVFKALLLMAQVPNPAGGIEFKHFNDHMLQEISGKSDNFSTSKDVILATRGVLIHHDDDFVYFYNHRFEEYVADGYNDELNDIRRQDYHGRDKTGEGESILADQRNGSFSPGSLSHSNSLYCTPSEISSVSTWFSGDYDGILSRLNSFKCD